MSYNLYDYSIKVSRSEKDNDYIAFIEEYPSISTFADSPETALRDLESVFNEWKRIQEEDGDPMPEPFKLQNFSGKTMIRIPRSLHKQLAEKAHMDNVSINQEITYCLTRGLMSQPGNP